MSAGIDVAMVLAAGLGTRMRPLTDDRPKALVDVGGRSLIDHLLDRLAEAGVPRAVVNAHHFADRLEAHLATRAAPRISISNERDRLLETGGALVRAKAALGEGPFFVCNIDSVWSDDSAPALSRLRDAWDPERMDALLLLADIGRQLGYAGSGDFFRAADGRLTRRGDRPSAPFAYMGLQIMHPRLLDGFPEEPFSANRMWDKASAANRLFGVAHEGYWMHVGDPVSRQAAEARLARTAT